MCVWEREVCGRKRECEGERVCVRAWESDSVGESWRVRERKGRVWERVWEIERVREREWGGGQERERVWENKRECG